MKVYVLIQHGEYETEVESVHSTQEKAEAEKLAIIKGKEIGDSELVKLIEASFEILECEVK